jgi:hypothetical protein
MSTSAFSQIYTSAMVFARIVLGAMHAPAVLVDLISISSQGNANPLL